MPSMNSRVGILKILKQGLHGMDLKTIVSINYITMGSLGLRAMVSMDRF
jgi:sulfur transfer protein SufE